MIECKDLCVTAENGREILKDLSFRLPAGSFLAVLGENGAGKTTLLDTLMGFRKPSRGHVRVMEAEPARDHCVERQHIAYLSEKVDLPADWTARDFLEFNRFFYREYRTHAQSQLLSEWGVAAGERIVNLSAGELRRVQIVAALCQQPRLFIVDEISAVLDIVGRRKFMKTLRGLHRSSGAAVIFATNILEDLEESASDILILRRGEVLAYQPLAEFMKASGSTTLSDAVAERIERQ